MDLHPNIDAVSVIDSAGDEHRIGVTDKRYSYKSVTKLLTTHVVADAIQSGFIFLDDNVDGPFVEPVTVVDLMSHASGIRSGQDAIMPRTKRIYTNEAFDLLEKHVIFSLGEDFEGETIGSLFRDGIAHQLDVTITIDGSCAHAGEGTFDDLVTFAREVRNPQLIDEELHGQLVTPYLPALGGIVPGWGHYEHNTWGIGYEIKGDKSPHWMGTLSSSHTYGHFGSSGTFLMHDPDANISICGVTNTEFGPWAKEAFPELHDWLFSQYQ